MGKSQNPVEAYRKAEKKKEVKKNKIEKANAREAKVIQTRSIKSIQNEIANTQKQAEQNPNRQDIPRKIERLQKELKIVKEAAEKEKKNKAENNVAPQQQERKEEFNYDVRISLYYDPIYNPFGVAPPGKQILYHSKDGGSTKNRYHGYVPDKFLSEEELLARRNKQHLMQLQQKGAEQHAKEKEKVPLEQIKAKETSSSITDNESKAPPTPKQISTVNLVPDLPAPSESVQRLLRRTTNKPSSKNPLHDIWATTDEIQLHSTFEGVSSSKKKHTNEQPNVWYYIDNTPQKNMQGPYASDVMKSWFTAGFFPPSTPVKRLNEDKFQPIGQVSFFKNIIKPNLRVKKKHDDNEEEVSDDVLARINALKNGDKKDEEDAPQQQEPIEPQAPQVKSFLLPPPPPPAAKLNTLMSDIPVYPIDEEEIPAYPIPENEEEEEQVASKGGLKSYKGDQEIVMLMPSHLQKKQIKEKKEKQGLKEG